MFVCLPSFAYFPHKVANLLKLIALLGLWPTEALLSRRAQEIEGSNDIMGKVCKWHKIHEH